MADRMVEKVAKAAHDAHSDEPWQEQWDDLGPNSYGRLVWKTVARAALSASHHEELVEALNLSLSAFDNSLRSAGSSTAGFIASRKLMNKAQKTARAALAKVEASDA